MDKQHNDKVTISGQYIFGDSIAFKQIVQQIELVGPTNYSVIIYGESGSGKEAIAQEIHKRSKRSKQPFIAIDCGALSKELAGSELFGHEKGAFTGALNQKVGSFELANGGTIFLDEIANLSYDIQVSYCAWCRKEECVEWEEPRILIWMSESLSPVMNRYGKHQKKENSGKIFFIALMSSA